MDEIHFATLLECKFAGCPFFEKKYGSREFLIQQKDCSQRIAKLRLKWQEQESSKFWSGVKYRKRVNNSAQVMLSIH